MEIVANRKKTIRAVVTTASIAGLAVLGTSGLGVSPAGAAPSNTIYVNVNGADAPNCGTVVLQCKTIQAGVQKAVAGDTVVVAAGTYNGSVDITSGITVKSADGAPTTFIDGTGLTLPNGLVNITQPAGNVTFTGFTVENPTPSSNGDTFGLTIDDAAAADTITVSNNVFTGEASTSLASSIGVNSADTAATQSITGNEFSGLYEGILLEGSSGPVDVSNNNFHNLHPSDADAGATYPPKGIFFLGDKNVTATNQNVTNNTFSAYGGIGVDYRAGYNLGGCTVVTCDGTLAGAATGNTFALTAPAVTNSTLASQQPAAISVQSLYADDALNLTLGGNTGTVVAPTQPIIEVPGAGSITISPVAANKIVPQPAPTLSVTVPSTIVAGGEVKDFTASATNDSGETIPHARYSVRITGTKGITGSQIKLQYDADPSPSFNYQDIVLTGTASAGGAITGSFGPPAGFDFPSSSTPNVTAFRLSFPDSTTPPDTLTTTVQLDQVSTGTGNPVINTQATTVPQTTAVTAPPPAPVATVVVTLGAPVEPDRVQVATVQVADVNGEAPAVGTEVDVLVSGATVANGTVQTNAGGSARFLFRIQHAGKFTVKAVAGSKSGTATATTPLRHVTTALRLTTPRKGVITVVGTTSPARPGVKVAIVVDQGGTRSFPIITVITDSKGVATRDLTGLKSGGVYGVIVRVYGDPDSDSVNSPRMLIRVL